MSPSPMSRKRSTPYATAWSQARGRSSTPLVRAARAAARASMSNSLAIAAVTSSIRFVIDRSLQQTHPAPVGGARVVTRRPEELTAAEFTEDPAINVYCYLATPNHAWNLTDLPTRRANGSLVHRPVAALDLHYLISC